MKEFNPLLNSIISFKFVSSSDKFKHWIPKYLLELNFVFLINALSYLFYNNKNQSLKAFKEIEPSNCDCTGNENGSINSIFFT